MIHFYNTKKDIAIFPKSDQRIFDTRGMKNFWKFQQFQTVLD